MEITEATMDKLYPRLLRAVLENYHYEVAPRGMPTKEILNMHLTLVDPRAVMFYDPVRNLNYRFMLAEWLWIMDGKDDVESLAKYNKNMAKYSDNGVSLAGAYGPKIRSQLPYVVAQLMAPYSRQAVLTIWERSPEPSKDIPCTVAVQFLVRHDRLHTLVTMRSSDAWFGIPYDFFNFTMLGAYVAHRVKVDQGPVHFNLGSSHLYEPQYELAKKLVLDRKTQTLMAPEIFLGLHFYRQVLENAKSSAEVLYDLFAYGPATQ